MMRHPKPNFRHEDGNDGRRAGACPGLADASVGPTILFSWQSGAATNGRNSPKLAEECGNVYENKRSALRSPRQSCPGLADASVGPTILFSWQSGVATNERNALKLAKECGNVYENTRSASRSPRQSCPGLADASVGPTILFSWQSGVATNERNSLKLAEQCGNVYENTRSASRSPRQSGNVHEKAST